MSSVSTSHTRSVRFADSRANNAGGQPKLHGVHGEELPSVPFLIVAVATEEDYTASVERRGGQLTGKERWLKDYPYIYFVATD